MITCFTSTFALGGRPELPLFADEQLLAVAQLEHSLEQLSSGVVVFVVLFAMMYL
jgi:ABC-type uncharacterized transport system permease subunit